MMPQVGFRVYSSNDLAKVGLGNRVNVMTNVPIITKGYGSMFMQVYFSVLK